MPHWSVFGWKRASFCQNVCWTRKEKSFSKEVEEAKIANGSKWRRSYVKRLLDTFWFFKEEIYGFVFSNNNLQIIYYFLRSKYDQSYKLNFYFKTCLEENYDFLSGICCFTVPRILDLISNASYCNFVSWPCASSNIDLITRSSVFSFRSSFDLFWTSSSTFLLLTCDILIFYANDPPTIRKKSTILERIKFNIL